MVAIDIEGFWKVLTIMKIGEIEEAEGIVGEECHLEG
jgi:hypothetical protein